MPACGKRGRDEAPEGERESKKVKREKPSEPGFHALRQQIREQGTQSRVQVNQRALIDKMLARYAGHLSTFRELTQNADDASATHIRIEVQGTWDASTARATNIQDILVSNNGRLFTEQDWTRVSKIAEGNPDEQTVGMFGVGFYSVFAMTDEPIIGSGGEWMGFYWDEDQLCFGRLPGEDTDPRFHTRCQEETLFLFPVREKEVMISLGELEPFFQSVLYFSRSIDVIQVLVNEQEVLMLQKERTSLSPLALGKDEILTLPEEMIQLLQPSLDPTQVPSVCAKLRFQPQNSQVTCFSIHSSRPHHPRTSRNYLMARISSTTQAEVSFHGECQRILKKKLPTSTHSSLLLDCSSPPDPTFDVGKLYVGISTHQRTGCRAHMAGHFYPTIERENIDFRDPYLSQWNALVLYALGRLSYYLYQAILSTPQAPLWRTKAVSKEAWAHRVAGVFAFETTIPQELIQQVLLSGFFSSQNKKSPWLLTNQKRMPANHVYWCPPSMRELLGSLGLSVPASSYDEEPFPTSFFHHMRTRGGMKSVTDEVLFDTLPQHVLSSSHVTSLLHWLLDRDVPLHFEYIKDILSHVTYHESEIVPKKRWAKITRYAVPEMDSLPVPASCLPAPISQCFSPEVLKKRLGLSPYQPKDWIVDFNRGKKNILRQYAEIEASATSILAFFSTYPLGRTKRLSLVQGLRVLSCIPTTHGMKRPEEAALLDAFQGDPQAADRAHLVTLSLRTEEEEEDQGELMDLSGSPSPTSEALVSKTFLRDLGVRVAPAASVVVENLLKHQDQSHESVLFNLYEQRNGFSESDWDHIRQVPFFRCRRGEDVAGARETKQCAPSCFLDLSLVLPTEEITTEQKEVWRSYMRTRWIIQWKRPPSPSMIKFLASHFHIYAVPPIPTLFHPLCGRKILAAGLEDYRTRFVMLMLFWTSQYQSQCTKEGEARRYRFVLASEMTCVAVDEVFLDPTPFGPPPHPLVQELARQYHVPLTQLGIAPHPSVPYILDQLQNHTAETIHDRNAADCLECLSGLKFATAEMKVLKSLAFIPYQGTYKKPSEIFLRSEENAEEQCPELFTYLSFTPLADDFLLACGAKQYPAARDWVNVFIEGTACRLYFQSPGFTKSRYLEMLKQLAGHVQSLPASWKKKLMACRTLWGVDEATKEQGLYAAEECYLLDNTVWSDLLRPVLAPSGCSVLTKLYSDLGSRWLTSCVDESATPQGTAQRSEQTQTLEGLIRQRYPLFLCSKSGETLENIRPNATTRLKHLVVREFEGIHRTLQFRGRQVPLPHGEEISMCTVWKGKTLALHQGSELNYFDIGLELSRVVTDDQSMMEALGTVIAQQLQTPLSSLRSRGYAIDRILGVDAIPHEQHKKATQQESTPMVLDDDTPAPAVMIEDFSAHAQSNVSSLESLVKSSRPRRGKTIKSASQNQERHEEDEADEDCAMEFDVELDADLVPQDINLYRTPDSKHDLSPAWIQAYRQFYDLLQVITECIPQLKGGACKIFLDEKSNRIAFNYNCTLFFNLRYYYQCHYQSHVSYERVLFFWFVTTCHELAHNREFSHNKEHGRIMEELIAHYGHQVMAHLHTSRPRPTVSNVECVDLTL